VEQYERVGATHSFPTVLIRINPKVIITLLFVIINILLKIIKNIYSPSFEPSKRKRSGGTLCPELLFNHLREFQKTHIHYFCHKAHHRSF